MSGISRSETFRRPRFVALGVAVLALVFVSTVPAAAQIPGCLQILEPIPSGQPDRPGVSGTMTTNDHNFIHSSTLLQGLRAKEKWTGTLVYRPPTSTGFEGFTSAVIVDNPDPERTICVYIDYFSEIGTLIQTTGPHSIDPDGFYPEPAYPLAQANGVGAARVRTCDFSEDDPGFVGATLLHSRNLFNLVDVDQPFSTNGVPPGMSSMQQLQAVQNTPELWWGPVPVTRFAAADFHNGATPFFTVVNPNPTDVALIVDYYFYDRNTNTTSGPFNWRTVALPAFGSLTELTGPHLAALGTPAPGLWNYINSLHAGGSTPVDLDVIFRIYTEDGQPILGDGVLTDVWKDGTPPVGPVTTASAATKNATETGDETEPEPEPEPEPVPMVLGKHFRMVSTALNGQTNWFLVSADASRTNTLVEFIGGVSNLGANTVNARFQYFDRDGNLLSTGTAPLVPGQSVRIEPGAPGYPPGPNLFSWVRVFGCNGNDRLIGWTGHEILEPSPSFSQYHKAFAQTFDGLNVAEPGEGIEISDVSGIFESLIRKVAPIQRATPSFQWPGYVTAVNESVSSIGPYRWQFFTENGFNCTIGGASAFYFGGLPWGTTSTTYVDPEVIFNCPEPNLMGTFDQVTGEIEGNDVLGDPFDEWRIIDPETGTWFADPRWFPTDDTPPFPVP